MTTAAAVLSEGAGAAGAAPAADPAAALLQNPPAAGWWDQLKDPELKSWAANKAYPDPEHALMAHRGLEKLYGADKAGRTALLPKDENDTEGWKALASKLGVPEKADDYKLPLPEGADPAFAKDAASWFHEAGVPPRAANLIATKWNEYVAGQVKAGMEAEAAESAKQMQQLEAEMGPAFTQNRELAQRGYAEFAKQFGLDDRAKLDRLESVIGAANLTKLFMGLGKMNSESQFAGADGKGGGFTGGKQAAQDQFNQLTADRIAGKVGDREFQEKSTRLMQVLAA